MKQEALQHIEYWTRLPSPLGTLTLGASEAGLAGLWMEGQKNHPRDLPGAEAPELPLFAETARWLALYFSGQKPDFLPPLAPEGTPFQQAVWALLREIPYGQTVSYGELARRLALRNPSGRVSARAVGGAVGRNPVSILIPCHRVIGADGRLTGYDGGLDRKRQLLTLEGVVL